MACLCFACRESIPNENAGRPGARHWRPNRWRRGDSRAPGAVLGPVPRSTHGPGIGTGAAQVRASIGLSSPACVIHSQAGQCSDEKLLHPQPPLMAMLTLCYHAFCMRCANHRLAHLVPRQCSWGTSPPRCVCCAQICAHQPRRSRDRGALRQASVLGGGRPRWVLGRRHRRGGPEIL